MLSGVAVIEHIDLTAVFTYRTMSYDIATISSGVVESCDVVRHRASRHPALSYDVVRTVNTAELYVLSCSIVHRRLLLLLCDC